MNAAAPSLPLALAVGAAAALGVTALAQRLVRDGLPERPAHRAFALGLGPLLAALALAVRAATRHGAPPATLAEAAVAGALVGALVVASTVDLARLELPDGLTLGGAALALASSPWRAPGLAGALAGTAAGLAVTYLPSLLFRLVRGREGVGGGDVKLLVLAGAWFGWEGALLVTALGAAQTVLAAGALRALGIAVPVPPQVRAELEALRARADAGDAAAREELEGDPLAASLDGEDAPMHLPMGPFLALACVEALAVGPVLVGIARAFLLT